MKRYDDELIRLEGQAAMATRLRNRLNRMLENHKKLQQKEAELGAARAMEEEDVEKLEGRSLSRFFLFISGKLDEKLDQERQEAYEAAVKYDAVVAEMRAQEADIRDLRVELREAEDAKARYEQVLREKRDAIKALGSETGKEILDIERALGYLEDQRREINEALKVGSTASRLADDVLNNLSSAKNWSTWDMLGGGLIADVAKHGRLDEAQSSMESLQVQLSRFRNELADVAIIGGSFQVNIDGGLRFADYFFDGLFVDWTVYNRIDSSSERVRDTRRQIDKACSQLRVMRKTAEQDEARLRARLEELVKQEQGICFETE